MSHRSSTGAPDSRPIAHNLVVHAAASSHTGRVHAQNEDSFAATGMARSHIDDEIHDSRIAGGAFLAVVADGLGGHPHGERASAIAVGEIANASVQTEADLVAAVRLANESLYRAMSDDPRLRAMGTTVAALLVHGRGVSAVNVGDSAVLELDRGRLVQLTEDDVPAGAGRLPGMPTSIVTQTLGGSSKFSPVEPHVYCDECTESRRFLVCSDGLTNFVALEEIRDALTGTDPVGAVRLLLDLTLEAGAPDNVTVIVVDARWGDSDT